MNATKTLGFIRRAVAMPGHGRMVALELRPPTRDTATYASTFVELAEAALYVLRTRWVQKGERTFPQVPLTIMAPYRDLATGQIVYDGQGCQAAYDVAIPHFLRRARGYLDIDQNPKDALAAAELWEAMRKAAARRDADAVPTLPEFYYAFPADAPPKFERSRALEKAALELLAAPHPLMVELYEEYGKKRFRSLDAIRKALGESAETFIARVLELAWQASVRTHGTYTCLPASFFARSGEYDVHPLDQSLRPMILPEHAGATVGAWLEVDGQWMPRPQRPARVFADISAMVGRQQHSPAFEVLQAKGLIPADVTYAAWRRAAPEGALVALQAEFDKLNSFQVSLLLAAMREQVGPYPTNEDLYDALVEPRGQLTASTHPRTQVLMLQHEPDEVNMTFYQPAVVAKLYEVRPEWAHRYHGESAPAPRRKTTVTV